jgi:hypothetical protein
MIVMHGQDTTRQVVARMSAAQQNMKSQKILRVMFVIPIHYYKNLGTTTCIRGSKAPSSLVGGGSAAGHELLRR